MALAMWPSRETKVDGKKRCGLHAQSQEKSPRKRTLPVNRENGRGTAFGAMFPRTLEHNGPICVLTFLFPRKEEVVREEWKKVESFSYLQGMSVFIHYSDLGDSLLFRYCINMFRDAFILCGFFLSRVCATAFSFLSIIISETGKRITDENWEWEKSEKQFSPRGRGFSLGARWENWLWKNPLFSQNFPRLLGGVKF